MSKLAPSLARSHRVLLSRLLWPTAILFVATLLMVVSTFWWTSRKADNAALESQRERLHAALEQRLSRLGERFADHLASQPPSTAPSEYIAAIDPIAARFASFDGATAFPLGELSQPPESDGGAPDPIGIRRLKAELSAFLASLVPQNRLGVAAYQSGGRVIRSQLVSDGDRHFGVFAILVAPSAEISARFVNPTDLVVAWTRMDEAVFARIAALHGLRDFRITSSGQARADASLPILNHDSQAVAAMTWVPEAPGLLMQARLIPIFGVGLLLCLLLFGAVAVYFHWTTKDLAETEALSKELLGRDPLSGLANRLLFNERLDRELGRLNGSGPGLAVMFIDLDRFKDVNDAYGHQAGDDLIRLVAERLMTILPSQDTLARFGGDEFAVIQTGIGSLQDVEILSREILDTLTSPFPLAESPVTIGASIGVALAPEHATSRENLMKLADTALYQAKSEGRNRTVFFQTRMDETLRMRKVVEDDLRHAIQNDQLELYYQPLYSSDGDRIVGLEALVRWPHPERGMISPADFIPIAEERGLVLPLGEWVLRRACQDAQRWPGIRVAVNVSPIQFRHRSFVAGVVKVLEDTKFDPTRLELELTEGVVVADADAAEAAMVELRALGVHLALDDFGTGYSSLIYLRRFAFDKIKIDRSFLESMEATGESAILVHSIVHLGRALGLTVTAEGVETKEQHRFLQALGCHQLQGFLFSKPVPAHEVDRLLGHETADLAADAA